jgi:hypothetical protein
MSIAEGVNRDIPSRQSQQEVNLAEDEGFILSILGNSPFQTSVRVAIALIFLEA